MADLKISALTGASTPLAGTEVLPIVQSSTTKKVSIANITAGRDVSMKQLTATADSFIGTDNGGFKYYFGTFTNAAGGANNAYFSAGLADLNEKAGFMWQTRDATGELNNAFKLDGDQNATLMAGNLVQGTAAKGINFTANTPAAGMTTQLLNWYEEGTWTPNQGAGLTVVGTFSSSGSYVRVGKSVTVNFKLSSTTSIAATGIVALTSNLPFAVKADGIGAFGIGINGTATTSFIFQVSGSAAFLEASNIAATDNIYCSVSYITA
jgi:hypothetical protein